MKSGNRPPGFRWKKFSRFCGKQESGYTPKKTFSNGPNFRQIARDLNISATTLYRVLNL